MLNYGRCWEWKHNMSRSLASGKYLYGPFGWSPPVTYSCWIRLSNATSNYAAVCMALSSTTVRFQSLLAMGAVGGDPVWTYSFSGTGGAAGYISSFSATTWHHFAAVFASTTSRVPYLDGTVGTASATSVSATELDYTVIGANKEGSSYTYHLSGYIAHVAVWTAALDAGEIKALAARHAPELIRRASLAAYWPFGGFTGNNDLDRVNRNDLSLSAGGGTASYVYQFPTIRYQQAM